MRKKGKTFHIEGNRFLNLLERILTKEMLRYLQKREPKQAHEYLANVSKTLQNKKLKIKAI